MEDSQIIQVATARLLRERDRYEKLARYVAEICKDEIIDKHTLRATVNWRVKSQKSFADKLQRQVSKGTKLNSVDEAFTLVRDIAGVRISTYVESQREFVVEQVKQIFIGATGQIDKDYAIKDGMFVESPFYRATHCNVFLNDDLIIHEYGNLSTDVCEIQVTSLLAHVYNEIAHDLVYKPTTGELSKSERSLLDQLGNLTKAGDSSVVLIMEETERRTGPFVDAFDFATRMRHKFPEAKSFNTNAVQLFDDLKALSLNSPKAIEEALLDMDYKKRANELLDDFRNALKTKNEPSFYLNENTSDLLLMLLFNSKADKVLNLHPMGQGAGRPPRIAQLAKRFKEMKIGVAK